MENTGHDSVSNAAFCNGYGSHSTQGNGGTIGAGQANTVDGDMHISGSRRAAQADSAAGGRSDQAARQADSPALQQACFSEELVGIRVCFQVVDLGCQLYVWAGLEGGVMGCMCLASPPTGELCPASPAFDSDLSVLGHWSMQMHSTGSEDA